MFRFVVAGLALMVAGPAVAKEKKLDEAQVLGILFTSNAGEVYINQVAAARTNDPELRAYAMQVAEDHTEGNENLFSVLENNNLKVADSSMRAKAGKTAMKHASALWGEETGTDLDTRFLEDSIADHSAELQMIDEQLLPNARTAEVKELITETRSLVAEHLTQACALGDARALEEMEGCDMPGVEPDTTRDQERERGTSTE